MTENQTGGTGGGLPTWAWVLIALGIGLPLACGIFLFAVCTALGA